jgi:hypothetical protein
MENREWIPDEISLDRPSPARIYDYYLGGYHNLEVDRLLGEKALEIYPDGRLAAHAARAFLRRVVNFLSDQGIDQFLDIGSGIPTVGNVHEVAQKANPAARVVYVDIDPVAVAHSEAILADNANAIAIRSDVRRPEDILDHDEVKSMLDFSRPMGLLLLTMLHFVTDLDVAYRSVRTLREALASGSCVAISHGTFDNAPPDVVERMEKLVKGKSASSRYSSHAQILEFFEGLEMIEPGLVHIPLWRPEGPDDVFLDKPERVLVLGGVGLKP